ncbi:MAG: GAF domain-containing protein [Bacteroidetes bacterium]|nr:MAG: GAF domain-containing protein [Bacteroidota bacterium]TAG88878.1 MAG: GAF domain-containing protein [Bacteroidota bacterium]
MLSPKNNISIFIYVNVLSWVLLLIIRMIVLFGFNSDSVFDTYFYLKGLILNLYLLSVFFYFNNKIEKNIEMTFIDILINLFFRGLITVTLSLIIQLILTFIQAPPISESRASIINILYHIDVILVTIYLTQLFFYWKRLVLYQQTKILQNTWNTFEYILLISLLFNFFEFDLTHYPFTIALGFLIAIGFYLSLHLKWVAYLNAREKWQSIVLLLFIAGFSYYFFYSVISHSDIPYFTTDLMHSVFVLGMFVFVLFYSIFSLLVILFNLPTSSVFEQKLEEVIGFQRLAQAFESEENVYEILLDTAIEAIDTDTAWLEIKHELKESYTVERNLDKNTVKEMQKILESRRLHRLVESTFAKPASQSNQDELSIFGFESILIVPLINNEKSLGKLVLLKTQKEYFDEEKRQLIHTFAQQASVAIGNFRLFTKTLEAERYKEDLKIAQRVQESLLPTDFLLSDKYDISGFSQPAYEVGGDYYDVHFFDKKIILIIGDVSGKGTTAAFHMAQMKGIFQTLAQINDLTAEDFLKYANNALSNCLAKNTFITATLVMIDTEGHQIEIIRAGHCPALYFSQTMGKCVYLKAGGIGLGIIRNQKYENYIQKEKFIYGIGHLLVLYTDGLVEARDMNGEEFGEERLEKIIEENQHKSPADINRKIKDEVARFRHETPIFDDYTALIIKRNQ